MTIKEANQKLLFQLYHDYDNREAANIADWIMEHLTGWKKIDRIINARVPLSAGNEKDLASYLLGISEHKPVQYLLNEAWFCGLKFFVNENVLIPRPETEELVMWISSAMNGKDLSLLDIGTGSGCIAVALKKQLSGLMVHACDISRGALEVAEKNATIHHAKISFIEADIFDRMQWKQLPSVNIIVSNPPYIPYQEKVQMHQNVILHEPHTALFVNDQDPLVFYKAIAELAKEKLTGSGNIFVETHENYAAQTTAIFYNAGFHHVETKKDMQGKERMIRAY